MTTRYKVIVAGSVISIFVISILWMSSSKRSIVTPATIDAVTSPQTIFLTTNLSDKQQAALPLQAPAKGHDKEPLPLSTWDTARTLCLKIGFTNSWSGSMLSRNMSWAEAVDAFRLAPEQSQDDESDNRMDVVKYIWDQNGYFIKVIAPIGQSSWLLTSNGISIPPSTAMTLVIVGPLTTHKQH